MDKYLEYLLVITLVVMLLSAIVLMVLGIGGLLTYTFATH